MAEFSSNTRLTVVAPTFNLVGEHLYCLYVINAKAPVYDWRFLQGGMDGDETAKKAACREMEEEVQLDLASIPHTFISGRFSVLEGGRPRAREGQTEKFPKEYINQPILLREKNIPLAKPNLNQNVKLTQWKWVDPNNKYDIFKCVKPPSRNRLEIQLGEAIGRMGELGLIPETYTYKRERTVKY